MDIVNFGSTGIHVSKIGLGLAALGRPGYINLGHGHDLSAGYEVGAMRQQAVRMLEAAYQMGIRYFDVARSYGKGEAFLSAWLKGNPSRSDIVVGSKWGYTYTANWQIDAEKHEVKEHSLEVLERQWPESSLLLGKRLQVYHIHSATLESGVLENKEVLDKLWEMRSSGMVIGLSLSGEKQAQTLDKALTVKKGEQFLFQSVQATWNVLEQSATTALQLASENGFGVIVKEALANGRLTDRNTDSDFAGKMEVLKGMAEKYDVGIDALCIAFVLKQKWSSVVLSGAATAPQLKSNLAAISIELSDQDEEILMRLAETSEEYWKKRSALKWN